MRRIASQKRETPAKGSTWSGTPRRVSISFDDAAFDHISAEAVRRGVSFNSACRDVIRRGIAAGKEMENER